MFCSRAFSSASLAAGAKRSQIRGMTSVSELACRSIICGPNSFSIFVFIAGSGPDVPSHGLSPRTENCLSVSRSPTSSFASDREAMKLDAPCGSEGRRPREPPREGGAKVKPRLLASSVSKARWPWEGRAVRGCCLLSEAGAPSLAPESASGTSDTAWGGRCSESRLSSSSSRSRSSRSMRARAAFRMRVRNSRRSGSTVFSSRCLSSWKSRLAWCMACMPPSAHAAQDRRSTGRTGRSSR
mmetsp:Transcript_90890/g.266111  ORF Transcript_90890/g.266111 Transcript_90890/m.266111 type:complete len:241 (+) Transcript_90890:292-1014(+)